MAEIYQDRLNNIETLLVDGGYTGEKFSGTIRTIIGAEVKVSKRNEQHKFELEPLRWIVERTFGWLNGSRRISKDYERKIHSFKSMVILSYIGILLKRF